MEDGMRRSDLHLLRIPGGAASASHPGLLGESEGKGNEDPHTRHARPGPRMPGVVVQGGTLTPANTGELFRSTRQICKK